MGQSPASSSYNDKGEGLPFFQGKKDFGKIYPVPTEYCSEPKKIALENDILMSVRAPVGATNLASEECCIGRGLAAIRANNSVLSTGYLRYFLLLNEQKISDRSRGSTFASINKKDLEEISIPFPLLPQQQKIVSVLDTASQLVEKQKALIEKYDLFLKSKFIEMFGDPVVNPMGWEKVVLGDLIYSAKDGPHVSPQYADEGIPFLSTRHIKPNLIVWEDLKYVSNEIAKTHWKKCKPERGDILYSKGGTTGIAARVNTDREFAVWVHVALLKINHDRVNTIWLERMLNASYCYAQSQHLTRGIVNRDLGLKQMVKISMYHPPRRLQEGYAQIVEQVETIQIKEKKKLEKMQTLYDALMQRAFNGEIQ